MSSIPTIKFITGFTVTGLSTRTRNSDEFAVETAKIPALWQAFYSSQLINYSPVFGVYSDYESDASGFYTVTAGIASNEPGSFLASPQTWGEGARRADEGILNSSLMLATPWLTAQEEGQVSSDFNRLNIRSGNYLVFTGSGPMPATVIATWQQVWQYFTNETQQRRNFVSDFELYNSPEAVAIYIGIQ